MGAHHQATRAATAVEASRVNRAARPKRAANQRRGPTPWVRAGLIVPVSSSRPMSGAPQNTPMRAGSAMPRVPSARIPVTLPSMIWKVARLSQPPFHPGQGTHPVASISDIISERR